MTQPQPAHPLLDDETVAVPPSHDPRDPGRHRAIATLFQEHNQVLVRFLQARLGSESDAREVAQEAYVKLLQLENPGAISFLRAYLYKIALNLAIDRMRQAPAMPMEDIALHEELADAAAPDRSAMAAQQLRLLAVCLKELPEKCAQAFALHRFEDWKPAEIAAHMHITERMVRHHIVRAMVYCRLRLDGMTPEQATAEVRK